MKRLILIRETVSLRMEMIRLTTMATDMRMPTIQIVKLPGMKQKLSRLIAVQMAKTTMAMASSTAMTMAVRVRLPAMSRSPKTRAKRNPPGPSPSI